MSDIIKDDCQGEKWSQQNYEQACREVMEAETEIAALRSQLEEAREIIRPFAEEAENWTDGDGSERLIVEHFDAEEYNRSAFQTHDLLRARAFLKENEHDAD